MKKKKKETLEEQIDRILEEMIEQGHIEVSIDSKGELNYTMTEEGMNFYKTDDNDNE